MATNQDKGNDPSYDRSGKTPVDNGPKASQATNKKKVADRIKAIENRWGKEFTEVLADLHDHVYGTTPPLASAPAALVAKTVSATSVSLMWKEAEHADGIVDKYLVERAVDSGEEEDLTYAQVGESKTTSYADTGLTSDTDYVYRVRARDTAGVNGAYSDLASASTVVPKDKDSK